jgi:hypothetical protein
MDSLKITDDRREQIQIGKELFQLKKSSYPDERVKWMYGSIESLMTDVLRKSFSVEDLFYMSIYDYWCYGNTISEEIYFHFPFKTHEEKKKFMTFRSRLNYMRILNPPKYAHYFNNKYDTYLVFKDYYLRDLVKIESEADYPDFLDFVNKHPEFVVKPTSSHIGIGVRKIVVKKEDDLKLLFQSLLEEGRKNAEDSFNNDASFLLEELIIQDENLARFHPYSVNGIRLTTLKCRDGVKILYPWFKVGANKSFVTSAAFGTYDAGIDPETGVVVTDGYKENGECDAIHPLTRIPFKGFQIPQWDSLLTLANTLADVIPGVNYIGWDFVLTPKGWCIMEGNYTGDFMWQMFNQRGFKEEFESLTGIHIENTFWWQFDPSTSEK